MGLEDKLKAYENEVRSNEHSFSLDELKEKKQKLMDSYKVYSQSRKSNGLGTNWKVLREYQSAIGSARYHIEQKEKYQDKGVLDLFDQRMWDNQRYEFMKESLCKEIKEGEKWGHVDNILGLGFRLLGYAKTRPHKGKAQQSYQSLQEYIDSSCQHIFLSNRDNSTGSDTSLDELKKRNNQLIETLTGNSNQIIQKAITNINQYDYKDSSKLNTIVSFVDGVYDGYIQNSRDVGLKNLDKTNTTDSYVSFKQKIHTKKKLRKSEPAIKSYSRVMDARSESVL